MAVYIVLWMFIGVYKLKYLCCRNRHKSKQSLRRIRIPNPVIWQTGPFNLRMHRPQQVRPSKANMQSSMSTTKDVPLLITSTASSSERRITPSWTISQLKAKLEPITGIPPSSQMLKLRLPDQDGEISLEADDQDTVQIGRWPLVPYAEIKVHPVSCLLLAFHQAPMGCENVFASHGDPSSYAIAAMLCSTHFPCIFLLFGVLRIKTLGSCSIVLPLPAFMSHAILCGW